MKHNRPVLRNRKALSLLLCLCMLLGMGSALTCGAPVTAYAAESAADFSADEIHLTCADDLRRLAENCRLDSWSEGKTIYLDNNIDLNSEEFAPIASFSGMFDGQGYTISGLSVTEADSYSGLFGIVQEGAVICNLKAAGTVKPDGSAADVGGIAGRNCGTIENCTFNGQVTGQENTGAIVGINETDGLIQDCSSVGSVSGKSMTGGVAGNNSGTISGCMSAVSVNTINADSRINLSDLGLSASLDLSSVSSLDLTNVPTDTGGIAGYNCGSVLGCINSGAVGYSHVGYNNGGICGRSCGYLSGCTNNGAVNGRKDVGGIIGQMEPAVVTTVTASSLQNLKTQLNQLNELMDKTQSDAEGASAALQSSIAGMGDTLKSASASLGDITTTISGTGSADASGSAAGSSAGDAGLDEQGVSADTSVDGSAQGSITGSVEIAADTNLGGIASALSSLGSTLDSISGEAGAVSDALDEDLTEMNNLLDQIYDSTFSTIDSLTAADLIQDTSEIGIDDLTFGKAAECENSGTVEGDLNVGGIAGTMAQEYSIDPEDDLTQSIDLYEKTGYEVKAVLDQCINYGTVTVRHTYAGGITGRADLGFLYLCENYGEVAADSAEYIGGIAGLNSTNITNCYAKNELSGTSHVGGICGSAIEENADDTSASVTGCVSYVKISGAEEYYGAVSGSDAGTFTDNCFVSDTLCGLDQLNIAGAAEPVTFSEMTAIAGIPDAFKKLTVTFMVEGQTYKTFEVDYGASLDSAEIPAVPAKDDCYSRWSRSDFSDITFDIVVNAVYSDYSGALTTDDTRSDGRSVFFIQGNFADDAEASAELLDLTSSEIRSELPYGTLAMKVGEAWKLSIPEDGQETHTVRYLVPDGKTQLIRIYQKTDEGYEQLSTEQVGSYLCFRPEGSEVEIAAVKVFPWKYVFMAAGLLVILILLILFIAGRRLVRKVKGKKQGAEPVPAASDETALQAAPEVSAEAADAAASEGAAAGDPKKEKRQKRRNAKMKKARKALIIILVVIIAAAAGVFAFAKLRPDLASTTACAVYLKAMADDKTLQMDLDVTASADQNALDLEMTLTRAETEDGTQLVAADLYGVEFYYADGVVYMEDGTAWALGDSSPDYASLPQTLLGICENIEIEHYEENSCDCFKFTAADDKAANLMEYLCPVEAQNIVSADNIEVVVKVLDNAVSEIDFSGAGTLNSDTDIEISAVITVIPESVRTVPEIPQAVSDAIQSGAGEEAAALTSDMVNLLKNWGTTLTANPLTAQITIGADCGLIDLDTGFKYTRTTADDGTVTNEIDVNGITLYFDDNGNVWDSGNNPVSEDNLVNLADSAKLIDVAYKLCMTTRAEVQEQADGTKTYTLTLDDDTMQEILADIAPSLEDSSVSFRNGTIVMTSDGTRITGADIRCTGSVNLLITEMSATLSADMTFPE